MATFAGISNKKMPQGAGPDSKNILPFLLGKQSPDSERYQVFSSGGTRALCIRKGKWKYMDGQGDCGYREFFSKKPHPKPKAGDPLGQLYNLDEDLGEKNNLYRKYPKIVQQLKRALESIKALQH